MRWPKRQTAELLDLFLTEDMPWPFLEIVLIAALALPVLGFGLVRSGSTESTAVQAVEVVVTSSFLSVTLFTFLIMKNMAFGICQALHSGEWAVYMSYPVSRRRLFVLRLASAWILPMTLYLFGFWIALWAAVPSLVLAEPKLVFITTLGTLQPMLLLASFISLLSLKLREGSSALFAGFILYIVYQTLAQIVTLVAILAPSSWIMVLRGVLQPSVTLADYAGRGDPNSLLSFIGFLGFGIALSVAIAAIAMKTFTSKSSV